jgi:hypothetical protein
MRMDMLAEQETAKPDIQNIIDFNLVTVKLTIIQETKLQLCHKIR